MPETDDRAERPIPFDPFHYGKRQKELSDAILARIRDVVHARQEKMIDARNMFSYRHGQEWSLSSHSADQPEFSRFHAARADASVWYRDIVDHKLQALTKYITHIADEFEQQFQSSMFQLLHETTEATGNVVNLDGDFAKGFIELLTKIEIGVDRSGRPTMPIMFVGSEQFKQLQQLEEPPPKISQQIEELKARKEADAILREVKRISKFRWG
jgi:hypothetical protein